jgi:hypothetical protein
MGSAESTADDTSAAIAWPATPKETATTAANFRIIFLLTTAKPVTLDATMPQTKAIGKGTQASFELKSRSARTFRWEPNLHGRNSEGEGS